MARRELFERGTKTRHRVAEGVDRARGVWFGVGLVGRTVSPALPIDVALMVLAQETIRRELALPRAEILIADENAVEAGWGASEIDHAADRTKRELEGLLAALGARATVFRASALSDREERRRIASRIDDLPGYVALQLTQMEWMRRRGSTIKLGWSLGKRGRDEVRYDGHYAEHFDGELSSLYTVPGRTLDPRRPRACPYVCADPQARLLVGASESVDEKLALAPPVARRGYERLLGKIVRAYCGLTGRRAPRDPRPVIADLLDRAAQLGGVG